MRNDPLSDLLGSIILHYVLNKVLGPINIDVSSHLGREGGQLEHLTQLAIRLVWRVHHVLADLGEVLLLQARVKGLFWEFCLLLWGQSALDLVEESPCLVQSDIRLYGLSKIVTAL